MNVETDYEDATRMQVLLKGEAAIVGVDKKVAKRVVRSLVEKAMRVSQGIPPNVVNVDHSKWLLSWKKAGGDVDACHPQPVGIPAICTLFDPHREAEKLCELAARTFLKANIPFNEIEGYSLGVQQLLSFYSTDIMRYRLLMKSVLNANLPRELKNINLSDCQHPFVVQAGEQLPTHSEISSTLHQALSDSNDSIRMRKSNRLRSVDEQRDVFIDLVYYYYFISKEHVKAVELLQSFGELLDNAENNLIVVLGDEAEPEPDTSCSDDSIATMSWIRKRLLGSKKKNHRAFLSSLLSTRLDNLNRKLVSQSNNLLASTYISTNITSPSEEEFGFIFLHRLISIFKMGVRFSQIKHRALSLLRQTTGTTHRQHESTVNIAINILSHQRASTVQKELIDFLSKLVIVIQGREEEKRVVKKRAAANNEIQPAPDTVARINTAVKRKKFGKKMHASLLQWCEGTTAYKLSQFPALQNIPSIVSALVKMQGNGKLFPVCDIWEGVDDDKLPLLTPNQITLIDNAVSLLSEVFCDFSFLWERPNSADVVQMSQLLHSRGATISSLRSACSAVLHSMCVNGSSTNELISVLSQSLKDSNHLEAVELVCQPPSDTAPIESFSNDMRLLLPVVRRASVLRTLSSVTSNQIVQQLCEADLLVDDDNYPTSQIAKAIASFEYRRMSP
eukprot:TRINITY_DN7601_c0_g1_i1.p1 TRINITY_DN7601_c0_g1~~TRINITY_DN7601_c0_g1_i1.p1  ORF type:complete len:675 (+),score=137.17 TRINITY_DN7601_c0_g1_i1:40-2064(+)